jgi:hypothetical protein
MALSTNTKSPATTGIANHAVGRCVTDATAAAAAQSFNVGFVPRVIRFHNLTDRISAGVVRGHGQPVVACRRSPRARARWKRDQRPDPGHRGGRHALQLHHAGHRDGGQSKTFAWEAIG